MNSRSRTPFGNNPPDKRHVTVPAHKLKPGRVIIVGDVHGCLDELDALLAECGYQQEVDNLILAGDVVNKGRQSVEALHRAQQLGALVVRGNHEDACIALKRRFSIVSTLSSNYKWLKGLTDVDVEYMQSLPFTIALPSHSTLVVHAGLVPQGVPLAEQTMKDMLFLEEVDPVVSDGSKYKCYYKERQGTRDSAWARYWQGPQHVFFGHAGKADVQRFDGATGLDTACVNEGKLSACILPSAADLAASAKYQEYCKKYGGSRAPTLEELGAEIRQVAMQSGSQLPTAPSADHCSEKFACLDEQQFGLQTTPSGPVPDIIKPPSNKGMIPTREANLTMT